MLYTGRVAHRLCQGRAVSPAHILISPHPRPTHSSAGSLRSALSCFAAIGSVPRRAFTAWSLPTAPFAPIRRSPPISLITDLSTAYCSRRSLTTGQSTTERTCLRRQQWACPPPSRGCPRPLVSLPPKPDHKLQPSGAGRASWNTRTAGIKYTSLPGGPPLDRAVASCRLEKSP